MVVETYSIDKTVINVDDRFCLVTEDEKQGRSMMLNNLLVSLIQKTNNEKR